jgi:hypothetical protein
MQMKRFIREPLVQFLVLGALLFVIGGLRDDGGSGTLNDRIAITPGHIDRFIAGFELTWQRPPTPGELEGLIDQYIDEEILYREALAMGLDRDDEMVRRRMAQKLEFLTRDLIDAAEPPDEALQEYLDANLDRYRHQPRFSFVQVYLSEDRRGAGINADAARILEQLRARPGADPSSLGDALSLPAAMADAYPHQIGAVFGSIFAENLAVLEVGSWQGPVRSGYGIHLVRIDERVDGRAASLDEVRDVVRRDFMSQRRSESNDSLMRQLRERYTVIVEWPEDLGGGRAEIR